MNNQIRSHTTHADLWLEFILCTSWSACCWHCSANVKRVAIPTGLICDTQRNEKHGANNKKWRNQVWKTYTAMTTASNPSLSPKPWQPLAIWARAQSLHYHWQSGIEPKALTTIGNLDWAQCHDNHWQSGLEPNAITTIGNLVLGSHHYSLDHQATQGHFYAQGKTDTETNFFVTVGFTIKKKKKKKARPRNLFRWSPAFFFIHCQLQVHFYSLSSEQSKGAQQTSNASPADADMFSKRPPSDSG